MAKIFFISEGPDYLRPAIRFEDVPPVEIELTDSGVSIHQNGELIAVSFEDNSFSIFDRRYSLHWDWKGIRISGENGTITGAFKTKKLFSTSVELVLSFSEKTIGILFYKTSIFPNKRVMEIDIKDTVSCLLMAVIASLVWRRFNSKDVLI